MSNSDENKSLTPDDERVVDMVRKLTRERKEAQPMASRLKPKVEFLGEEKLKREVQGELDGLDHSDRMWAITQDRKIQILKDLKNKREGESYRDGLALYAEHREMLNTDFSDDDDHDEAFWVMKRHLDTLYKMKLESGFWEDLGPHLQD